MSGKESRSYHVQRRLVSIVNPGEAYNWLRAIVSFSFAILVNEVRFIIDIDREYLKINCSNVGNLLFFSDYNALNSKRAKSNPSTLINA